MSALKKHACLPQHMRAIQTLRYQEEWIVAKKKQEHVTSDSLDAQKTTAYFIVKKNFPLSLFPDLIELQQSNGAPTLQTGSYSHHETVTDFIKCISSSLDSDMKQKIEKSSFLGLMTGESVDIPILKKLVIYVQLTIEGKSKFALPVWLMFQMQKLPRFQKHYLTIFNRITSPLQSYWDWPVMVPQ